MPTTFPTHTNSPLEVIDADHVNDVQTAINTLETGWIACENTWVYVSASSFKIVGLDVTSFMTKGTKLKCSNSGTKYFYITSSSFSTDTTVNVTGGTDYVVANATISSPTYSYADNPQGFPAAFNYTPTGISASGVTLTGRFSLRGLKCLVDFKAAFTGAITFTTMPTVPITVSSSYKSGSTLNFATAGNATYWDNGTGYGTMWPTVIASGTTFGLYTTAGAAMSASAPITWANLDEINAHIEYEI